MATRTVNGSRKARKATPRISEAILAADLTHYQNMSDAARKAATNDATKAGRALALRALANVKTGESTPVDAAAVILSTFGDESTVASVATFGDARRKAHAAAVRTYVAGLHRSGALVSGKGKRPTATQVSQAALASALGVSRGRVSQIVMSLDSPDTHDANGKRTKASKATKATKATKGMDAKALAAKVEALDDAIDKGVSYTIDDVDTLRRAAKALEVLARRVNMFADTAAKVADVTADAKAS